MFLFSRSSFFFFFLCTRLSFFHFFFSIFSFFTTSMFGKSPSPKEQSRKWISDLKKQMRLIDRDVRGIQREEAKIKVALKKEAKLGGNSKAVKTMAKSLVMARNQKDKLLETKAIVNSTVLQIKEQQGLYLFLIFNLSPCCAVFSGPMSVSFCVSSLCVLFFHLFLTFIVHFPYQPPSRSWDTCKSLPLS